MSPATAETRVDGTGAVLLAEFRHDRDARALSVHYRLRNTGDRTLAVFDRGDRHAVLTGKLEAGRVARPYLKLEGRDVLLSHVALPLPNPTPTVPAVPLATTLEAGSVLEGRFDADLSLADDARRVRWCLGVLPFAEGDFDGRETARGVTIWRAGFDAASKQQLLCTPWYEVALGAFADS